MSPSKAVFHSPWTRSIADNAESFSMMIVRMP